MFGKQPSDVVITDINMPGMDGHEVITTFRKRHPGVPIVAISGGGAVSKDDLLINAAALGAVEVIMKPFEFGQFIGAVEGRSRLGAAGATSNTAPGLITSELWRCSCATP